MKKLKFIAIYLMAFYMMFSMFLFLGPNALAATDPDVKAGAAILVEVNTGKVLYEKNADVRMEPASITKVMTVLLAVEAIEAGQVSLSDMVTASENSWYDVVSDSSNANIQPGEVMSLEDLLYCALVVSAGEGCNIIAEYISGDVSTFIDLMNSRAVELGCESTNFANTHGLPNDNHYTTARDLFLIMEEANNHPLFAKIAGTDFYQTAATNMNSGRDLTNTNRLILPGSSYFYSFCTGGKTGSTNAAGYCLAATAVKENLSFISIVLGAGSEILGDGTTSVLSYTETKRLFEWGFDSFSYRTILSDSDLVTQVPIAMGDGADVVVLHPVNSITALLDNDIKIEDFTKRITIYAEQDGEELIAPVSEGDVLGEMTIYLDDESYGTVKLVANTSIDLLHIEYLKSLVAASLGSPLGTIFIIIVLLIAGLYIYFVIRYNRIRRAKRRKTEEKKRQIIAERQQGVTTGQSFEDIYEMKKK